MRGPSKLIAAALATFTVLALMGPTTGGVPARPKFQTVTAGTSAAFTNITAPGYLLIGHPTLAQAFWNVSGQPANGSLWNAWASGTVWSLAAESDNHGVDKHAIDITRTSGSTTLASIVFGNATDNPIVSVNGAGVATVPFTVNTSSEGLSLKGAAVGSSAVAYMTFRDSSNNRTGYVGDAGGADSQVTLAADAGGDVRVCANNCSGAQLIATSAGALTFNGVNMVPLTTTATATVVGCTTNPGPTARFVRNGNAVTMMIDTFSCTSNGNTFTLGVLVPAAYRPNRSVSCSMKVTNNGTVETGQIAIDSGGNTAYARADMGTGTWTGSGTKANSVDQCTYLLT